MSNSLIWPIYKTLSDASTLGQSGLGSDKNEGVLCISQSSSITGTLLLDCLVSYPGHLLVESYPSTKMQSVYSTTPADWANLIWIIQINIYKHFYKMESYRWDPNWYFYSRFRVDLGVMAMKIYSTFPKAPGVELQHQMLFSIMSRALVGE